MVWNWLRKAKDDAPADRSHGVGLELNSGLSRAATGTPSRFRAVALDEPGPELALASYWGGREILLGRAADALSRVEPHLICRDYLSNLGKPWRFKADGRAVDAESAAEIAVKKLAELLGGFEEVAAVVPPSIGTSAVQRLIGIARKAGLPWRASAVTGLAVAAQAGPMVLDGVAPQDAPPGSNWVVPIRRSGPPARSALAVMVEADDSGLCLSEIELDNDRASIRRTAHVPRLAVRLWKERILEALADRCVKQCRRDFRDDASAEQAAYDQIGPALTRALHRQRAAFSVRMAHSFQDLSFSHDEFAGLAEKLVRQFSGEFREFCGGRDAPAVVWVTHDAAKLPGLTEAIVANSSPKTQISILAPEAVAVAAAALVRRRRMGDLPDSHLDSSIGLEPLPPAKHEAGDAQRNSTARKG